MLIPEQLKKCIWCGMDFQPDTPRYVLFATQFLGDGEPSKVTEGPVALCERCEQKRKNEEREATKRTVQLMMDRHQKEVNDLRQRYLKEMDGLRAYYQRWTIIHIIFTAMLTSILCQIFR